MALSAATRQLLEQHLAGFLGQEHALAFRSFQRDHQPVVFVGPHEHHSNEVSWRQGLATVVEVQLAGDGGIDLAHLEALLQDPAYRDRPRIGSFSAASNVTGMRSPVHEIARLLHAHGAFACFEVAASAPYAGIDMNPPPGDAGGDPSIDAVFISPHKFLGGPGSSGVLVFNERLYHRELPPTVCGGGTVDYVSPMDEDFVADIEERERAGTSGVLQTLKAALAFEVKQAISAASIEARESELLRRAFERWRADDRIEILGNPDPARRIAIVSFNIRAPGGSYLHPKFVTVLLNDLFGIQSRAGCSCAGPYGHRLLDIGPAASGQYREWVRKGFHGIKPGWCRVGFHFVMDDAEADYVIAAVGFVAQQGYRFLPQYDFDVRTGLWSFRGFNESREAFSLATALDASVCDETAMSAEVRSRTYAGYLQAARELAESATGNPAARPMEQDFGALRFFAS